MVVDITGTEAQRELIVDCGQKQNRDVFEWVQVMVHGPRQSESCAVVFREHDIQNDQVGTMFLHTRNRLFIICLHLDLMSLDAQNICYAQGKIQIIVHDEYISHDSIP
jgi:ribonucleotide monophosphatase NagD (HAD superfamily)